MSTLKKKRWIILVLVGTFLIANGCSGNCLGSLLGAVIFTAVAFLLLGFIPVVGPLLALILVFAVVLPVTFGGKSQCCSVSSMHSTNHVAKDDEEPKLKNEI